MRRLYFILLICIISASSCKKGTFVQTALPTNTNGNTIYYTINGVAHKISGMREGFLTRQGVNYYITNNAGLQYINISSFNRQNVIYDDVELYVQADSPVLNTRYPVPSKNVYRSNYKKDEEMYYADTERSFVIFDHYENGILTGRFNFFGYNKDSSNTIELANGWFDISKQE